MNTNDLLDYADSLFKTALYKCNNTDEAEELMQETFLSALTSLDKGKVISNPSAYLNSILNNRYSDMLRRKYKLPTVSFETIDLVFPDNCADMAEELQNSDEAVYVRRELAFLAKTYREVMVRYYMKGESIEVIAKALSIPKGTVLSRLDTGRRNVKKGVERMDRFTENSYQPRKLSLGISGRTSLNNEPFSLKGSILEDNILLLAYEKPLSITEIANGLGIAAAYIEPIVEKLVNGELMKKTPGRKVYTDFPISFEADRMKGIDLQTKMVEDNFSSVWKLIETGLNQINNLDLVKKLNSQQAKKLESYFVVDSIVLAVNNVKKEFLGSKAIEFSDYPDRPNGGKWYASGACFSENIDSTKDDRRKYSISGRLQSSWDNYMGKKFITLYDYDTQLGRTHSVYLNFKYSIKPHDMLKLLFGIYSNKTDGIDQKYLELIPELKEIGLVTTTDNKAEVDIPILSVSDFKQLNHITSAVIKDTEKTIKADLFDLLEKSKFKVPNHLVVPEYEKYILSTSTVPMRFVFTAIEKGLFHKDVDHVCPAIIMIFGDDI